MPPGRAAESSAAMGRATAGPVGPASGLRAVTSVVVLIRRLLRGIAVVVRMFSTPTHIP
jgi:hypothetical protein